MKCLIPVSGRECGLEEVVDKKEGKWKRPSGILIYHHECEIGHKFHTFVNGEGYENCDCPSYA